METISTYHESGRTFLILKDEHGYWGIESKYVQNGKLTKQFNGISGHPGETAAEAIQLVSMRIRVDAMVAAGMDRLDAVTKVYEQG